MQEIIQLPDLTSGIPNQDVHDSMLSSMMSLNKRATKASNIHRLTHRMDWIFN